MGFLDWLEEKVPNAPLNPFVAAPQILFEAKGQEYLNKQAATPNPTFSSAEAWLGATINNTGGGQALTLVDEAVRKIPGVGFVLDLPYRSLQTATNLGASVGAARADGEDAVGHFFSADTWDRAWNSYTNPEGLTTGEVLVGRLLQDEEAPLDPLDAQDAQRLQQHAHGTWYGDLMGATIDVAAGFIAPPGFGLLKASRRANQLPRLTDAERVAEFEAETFATGGTPGAAKPTRVKDTVNAYLGRPVSAESQMDRLARGLERTDGIFDMQSMMSRIAPVFDSASDAGKNVVAKILIEANYIEDPRIRSHVKVNAFLAANGSPAAMRTLMDLRPEFARSIERRMRVPVEPGLYDDLVEAYAKGGDYRVNTVLAEHFDTAGAKAEKDALRKELGIAREEAKLARQLVAEVRALKPSRNGFDSQRLRESRVRAHENVHQLTAELKAAKADQAAARGLAKEAAKRPAQTLKGVKEASRAVGGSARLIKERETLRAGALDQAGLVAKHTAEARVEKKWVEEEYRQTKAILRTFDEDSVAQRRARLNEQGALHDLESQRQSRAVLRPDESGKAQLRARLLELEGKLDAAKAEQNYLAAQKVRNLMVQVIRRADANRNPGERSFLVQAQQLENLSSAQHLDSVDELAEVSNMLGETRTRIAELETRLAEAKADRDLLDSTPLEDPQAAEAWKADMETAHELRKDALASRRWIDAERRMAIEAERHLKRRLQAQRPAMNRVSDMLNELNSLGEEGYITIGRLEPSLLDRVKTNFRETVGEQYLYEGSSTSRPVISRVLPTYPKLLAAIGTPYARGAITLAEIDRGSRELALSLKRSRVFSGDEARERVNRLLAAAPGKRQEIVAKIHEEMLERVALDEGLTLEAAKEITQLSIQRYGEGRSWGVGRAAEDATSETVIIEGLENDLNEFNGPAYRSHLADTVDFIDPGVFRTALRRVDPTLRSKLTRDLHHTDEVIQVLNQMWKHGVLIRPGLGVRAMLDTGLRATALIGAATQFVQAVNGAQRFARRADQKALARLGLLHGGDITAVARPTLGEGIEVPIGAGETHVFKAYEDAADLQARRLALTKGTSVSKSLLETTNAVYADLLRDNSKWDTYKADSQWWEAAYHDQANLMLASPTVRHLLEDLDKPAQDIDIFQYTSELFERPGVRNEYNVFGQPRGISREDWVQRVIHEVTTMFPTMDLVKLAREGRLDLANIGRNFPPEYRFDVPGPHSVLRKDTIWNRFQKGLNEFYRLTLDEPDFWLARHPSYVTLFERYVREEAAAAVKALPEGEHLLDEVLQTIKSRARARAVSKVRHTFYDTTRHTPAGEVLSRLSPFFAPWEDAVMSWSRLIYDNPKRLFRLWGAWNAGEALNVWLPEPLIVDGNGMPLARGQEPEGGAYIAVPFKVKGMRVLVRKEALNSIAQGNVPWLPGWGPVAMIPATVTITKAIPDETALKLAGTDNWLGQQLLKSMYLDGELPESSAKAIAASPVPPAWRNVFREAFGVNGAQTKKYVMNKLYMDARRTGQPWNPEKALKEAERQAFTAATVRFVAQAGLGLSGRARHEAFFYVEQMHQLRSLSPEELKVMGFVTPEEAFAAKFPEAADLDWGISENQTGINATVNAQTAAIKNRPLVEKNPDLGWFIVGSENLAQGREGDEFSKTVHNEQLSRGYGLTDAKRRRPDHGKAVGDALAAMGWKEWTAFTTGLEVYAKDNGLPDEFVSFAKQRFRDDLGAENTQWLLEYTNRKDTLTAFYTRADAIAKEVLAKDSKREDMRLYLEYRQAREEVLAQAGLKGLDGDGPRSILARRILRGVGERLAERNWGFKQTWDRQLESEVEAQLGDELLLGRINSGAQ